MIIDANNLVLGRLASYAAKQALLGEKVEIVNAKEAVIIGDKKVILGKYQQKRARGNPHHGPFFPMKADRILRRTIKTMLPHRHYRGKIAFKNIRCHINVPEGIKADEITTVETAKMKNTTLKYLKLKDLVQLLNQK